MIPEQLKPTAWTSLTRPTNNSRKGIPNRRSVAKAVLSLQIETDTLPEQTLERLKQIYPTLPKSLSGEAIMCMVQLRKAISGDTYAFRSIMDRANGTATQGEDDPDDDQPQVTEPTERRGLTPETIELTLNKLKERYE